MKHYNIPIFISHYGCPNECTFCNQKKITGISSDMSTDKISKIILDYLDVLPKNATKEIAFFGGTFTGIKREKQLSYLKIANQYLKKNNILGIRISTRPDYITEDILEYLKQNNVQTIELGIQSLDNKVLNKVKRGYSKETVFNAIKLVKKFNFKLGIQIMPGLPGSTLRSDLETVKELIKYEPDMARIYPALVITNTELEEEYKLGRYIPLSLSEAIDRVIPIYKIILKNNIKIIRVGLQPSDDLQAEGVIISGPFHPAFKELVEGEIYYNYILGKIKDDFVNEKILPSDNDVEYMITSNEKTISRIVGINRKNKIRLNEKIFHFLEKYAHNKLYLKQGKSYYKKNRLKIKLDKSIKNGDFKINNNLISRSELF